ncbi:MAG: hypothetical protein AB9835_00235 [Eubacteriales bacterium]
MNTKKQRTSRAAVFAILTPAAVLLSLGIDLPFVSPVSLICIVGACVLYALSAVLYPSALLLIAAVLSPGIRLLSGGSVTQAFASLIYIPAGIALALAVLKKSKRTTAITGVAVGLAGYSVLIFALDAVIKKHTLYMSAVKEYIADWMAGYKALLLDMNSTVLTFFSNQSILDAEKTEELVDNYILNMNMLLPGLYAGLSIVLAFVITGLFAAILRRTGGERLLSDKEWLFTMSPASALLMFAAYLTGMAVSPYTSIGLTAINLSYMLTPGFYALGIRSITSGIRRGTQYPSSVGTIAGVLAVLVSISFSFLITLFIFIGVWSVLKQEINRLAKKFSSDK